MQLPLSDTYLFIGVPVLLGLSISTYSKYRRNKNQSSLYVALASGFLAVSLFLSGVPSLFTRDPQVLSAASFLAECAQAAFLLSIWLLVIKAFLGSKKSASIAAYIGVGILFAVSCIESATRNFAQPYPVTVTDLSNIAYDIVFADSLAFAILVGLNFLSLLFLGVYFWRSAKQSENSSQKIRLRGLAAALVIGGAVFALVPEAPFATNFDAKDIGISLVYLLIGVSLVIGAIVKRRNGQVVPPVQPAAIIDPPSSPPSTPLR